ncbi:LacI family DNA-binding transcriptional regulator [Paludisphaera mucosa]|uniref:LacI family DNA-binding transcriptional regulator n=1 Tax=Paludisphaera mucosa TaxID=3030827 RepID=A0ABT6F4F0_9BACT|nr:LacI family DNA-binding transcriptional regulator [Paludisphaera mucosa]MDG3002446.1 LacI family DNA-binding transcriptional regulator [Paludisphaera mucosa]
MPRRGTATAMAAGGRRATIRDVADRVGVSLITVSRALRRPEVVSGPVRERVREAVEALGYITNRAASGLASGTSRVVPVIVPSLARPAYAAFLDGVQAELAGQGFQVLLGTTEHRVDVEDQLVGALLGWAPAGLILSGVDHSAGTRRRLRGAGIAVVEAMDLADEPLDLNVGFSHRGTGEAAAAHLADGGRRRVAYAGTQTEMDQESVKRIAGFRAALRERGLPDHYILRGDEPSSLAAGGTLLDDLLGRFPDVDAVFFGDDVLAAGAILECRRRGLAVPGRLAVMGADDHEVASASTPAITTIAAPRREIGAVAARMLLDSIRGGPPEVRRVDVGFRIVERESTKGGRT